MAAGTDRLAVALEETLSRHGTIATGLTLDGTMVDTIVPGEGRSEMASLNGDRRKRRGEVAEPVIWVLGGMIGTRISYRWEDPEIYI